jgi:hypothetical protein
MSACGSGFKVVIVVGVGGASIREAEKRDQCARCRELRAMCEEVGGQARRRARDRRRVASPRGFGQLGAGERPVAVAAFESCSCATAGGCTGSWVWRVRGAEHSGLDAARMAFGPCPLQNSIPPRG